jgi:hypothetical protein
MLGVRPEALSSQNFLSSDVVVDFVLNEPDMLFAGGSMSERDLKHALKQN